ncbi:MAG: hypothetical protein ACRBG0_19310 [Lewinella sp.]|uniref:hypothetical protein n=1 Tax=Lewinella sp. TaxID=2004506 RepID=UPI003D6ADF0E
MKIDISWLIVVAIPALLGIIHAIRTFIKDAKDSGSKDADQDLKIQSVVGEIDKVKADLQNIKERLNGLDSKTAREIEKLEKKLETKLDSITELILKLMKP